MRKTIDQNLETLQWVINNTKEVNPVPASFFEVVPYNGGMTTTVEGVKYAGALARTPVLALVAGATTFILHYEMWLPRIYDLVAQALEFDLMIAGPDGKLYNGSCQCNIAAGNMWQVTK